MNISQQIKEGQTATVTIDVAPPDYIEVVEKELKKYSKQAVIKGFRPGAIPKSVVQKMYGKSILFDELNKIVSMNLERHLTDNNVHILGEPLPIPINEFETDWENPRDYSFSFEIGLAPEFHLNLPPAHELPFYEIIADDNKIDEYVEEVCKRNAAISHPEKSDNESILFGEFEELDEAGNIKEGGIKNSTSMVINLAKDEAEKSKFIGIEKGSAITFNPARAFQNNIEIAAMFGISSEIAGNLKSDFRLMVESINKRENSELNQQLFDKIYGEGNVKSEEEFRLRIKNDVERMYKQESERKLKHDIEDTLLDELRPTLPDEFLKRWLKAINKKEITGEQIENEYPMFAREMKLNIIESKIFNEQNFNITEDEIRNMAREILHDRFLQYGMLEGMNQNTMEGYIDRYLKKEENINNVVKNIREYKTFEYLKNIVKKDVKSVTHEDFVKINAEHHHHH